MPPPSDRLPENVSPEELYSVVQGLASQDPQLLSSSEKRFKAMLDMAGTFDGLNAIATSRNLPLPIRQQSIIQFKNAALSHWKARRLLSDGQKIVIRARSLELLDEDDEIISSCNSFIIGKLARQDYPTNWPSLIPEIVNSITTQSQNFLSSGGNDQHSAIILRRALAALNAILKEFSAMKMPSGFKTMGKIVGDIHPVLQDIYGTISANIVSMFTTESFATKQAADTAHISHLTYKCLSKLACWLWLRLTVNNQNREVYKHLAPWINVFFEASASQFQSISELRTTLFVSISAAPLHIGPAQPPKDLNATRSLDYICRHLRHIGKFFRRIQQLAPSHFITLKNCNELVLYGWSKVVQATEGPANLICDSHLAVFPQRLLVQEMVLFKESLAQWRPSKHEPESGAALSKDFVEGAVRILVTRFIPLKPGDLEAWSSDPEEWFNLEDKEGDQWEYELRPCAERVLMTFVTQYQEYVTPLIAMTFNQIIGQPTVDLNSVVQKEAIYCAVGRCAIRLKDVIPFERWMVQNLSSEAQETNPNFPIIKRRIAWVIGKWVSEELASPNSRLLWDILMHLLSDRGPGTDTVVRFAAASAVKDCVDSLKFEPDTFLPHLPNAVWQLVSLAAEAETLEAKRRVMQTLNVVIERMGSRIVPHMEIIAKPLPELWSSSADDFLFKGALLETVTKLIESSKEASPALNVITIPLIVESFSDKARFGLDEDGLQLWQAALRNAVAVDSINGVPSLLDVFPIAISLLSENLDLLGSVTSLVQSYVVLDPVKILQSHAVDLFCAFAKALSQANSINVKGLIIVLESLVQVTPSQLWAEPMHISGLFATFLKTFKQEEKTNTQVLTEHILLFARMALSDANALTQLMTVSALQINIPEAELWKDLLDQWWQRFDNMSEPRNRKLVAMGIADLVTTGRPEVLDRLNGEIVNLWLDVFAEMKEALTELSGHDANSNLSPLVTFWRDDTISLPDCVTETEGTPEYARWQNIYKRDPVESQKMTTYIAARLNHAQQLSGGTHSFEAQWLSKCDPAVLAQLRRELSS